MGTTGLHDIRSGRILADVVGEANDVGPLIRAARKSLGLSQKEAAKLIGVSQSQLSDWERSRGKPNVDNRLRIADRLNVNPALLFRASTVTNPDPGSSHKGTPKAGPHETGPPDQTRVLELENRIRQLEADLGAHRRLLEEIGAIVGGAGAGKKARLPARRQPKRRGRH
jgi:transcriptional regulator with XRE-family HTH domain